MAGIAGRYNRAMRTLTLALIAALAVTAGLTAQERTPVPKDSLELIVTGCLNDRMLEDVDVESEGAPVIRTRTFRLSAKKDVKAELKRLDHTPVRVTGIVRKIDLEEPGLKVKGGRVVIGPAQPSGPWRPPVTDPADRIIAMDVVAIESVGSGLECRK